MNFYAGCRLDRAGDRRRDTAWLEARLADPASRIVPVWRQQCLVAGPPEAPRMALLPLSAAVDLGVDPQRDLILLGMEGEAAFFAADLSAIEEPEAHPALAPAGAFTDLRKVGALVPRHEAAVLAYARALFWWHARHRFCGICGAPTASAQAGHVRQCTNADCGATHFPRTDPAVIMLVHDGGDRALLGRTANFPPGMYSTLAGFVEPGESLEEAVAREVREEAGVEIAEIRYHSSQPWPFPGSIMLGFTARAKDHSLTVDAEELEDARWFTRADIRAAREATGDDAPFRLPRRDSIARRLIEDWLDEG